MVTYAYLRVSTDDQTHDSQRQALAGLEIDREYVDTMSGAKTSRPALDQLLADVRKGDTIVVYRLDRLGRSMLHLVTTILGLAEKGITVRSVSEQIDTGTVTGRMMLSLMAGMAELERENIRERVTAGMAARKARGLPCGAPATRLRTMAEKGNATRQAERQAFAESVAWALVPLREEGLSLRQIAATLNERKVATLTGAGRWTHGAVKATLERLGA